MPDRLCKALCALAVIAAVSASPLIPQLEYFGGAFPKESIEDVSTELTLSTGSPSSIQSTGTHWHTPAGSSSLSQRVEQAAQSHPSLHAATTWNTAIQPLSEKSSDASKRPLASMPLNFEPVAPENGVTRFSRPTAIDDFPSIAMQSALHPGWLRFPADVTYFDPPWLVEAYNDLVRSLKRKQNRPFDHSKVVIPQEIIDQIEDRSKFLFKERGAFFKMRLYIKSGEHGSPGMSRPVEVLFKYHRRLDWSGGPLNHIISFWSTSSNGERLALLGVFHISRRAFEVMTQRPGVEKFVISTRVEEIPYRHFRVYLVPSTE